MHMHSGFLQTWLPPQYDAHSFVSGQSFLIRFYFKHPFMLCNSLLSCTCTLSKKQFTCAQCISGQHVFTAAVSGLSFKQLFKNLHQICSHQQFLTGCYGSHCFLSPCLASELPTLIFRPSCPIRVGQVFARKPAGSIITHFCNLKPAFAFTCDIILRFALI